MRGGRLLLLGLSALLLLVLAARAPRTGTNIPTGGERPQPAGSPQAESAGAPPDHPPAPAAVKTEAEPTPGRRPTTRELLEASGAVIGPGRLTQGGPPPDGIPAIDQPQFVPASGVTWLGDREPVAYVDLAGTVRGYPLRILMYHEIVNDRIGELPVAITYCPLCNSVIAFDRRLGDRILSFGTSGMLYNSDLVMYDR
jgi:hypothetical protein